MHTSTTLACVPPMPDYQVEVLPAWLETNYAIGTLYRPMLYSKLPISLSSSHRALAPLSSLTTLVTTPRSSSSLPLMRPQMRAPPPVSNKWPTSPCPRYSPTKPKPSIQPVLRRRKATSLPLPSLYLLNLRHLSKLRDLIRHAANFTYDDPPPTHPHTSAFMQLPDPATRFGDIRRPTTEPPSPPPPDVQRWLSDCTHRLSINFLEPTLPISLHSLKTISLATSVWTNSSRYFHLIPLIPMQALHAAVQQFRASKRAKVEVAQIPRQPPPCGPPPPPVPPDPALTLQLSRSLLPFLPIPPLPTLLLLPFPLFLLLK